ncbi:MAG: hypothetical protein LBD67_10715 [Candidatus Accumulibacter sp.]|nr:hypothetical protein [Accumulibacter sp.]
MTDSSVWFSHGLDRFARFDTRTPEEDIAAGETARESASSANGTGKNNDSEALTPDEERLVRQLKQRDREVRQHEQAHVAAGSGLVRGGAVYSYQTGPDKQRYAVGGEVSIDTSGGRTPEETLSKARRIRAAALAPADPSPQDRSVAAKASRMENDARMEIDKSRREEAAQKQKDAPQNNEAKLNKDGFTANADDTSGIYRNSTPTAQPGLRLDVYA